MLTYYKVGDAIEGERIIFNCRKINQHRRPIRGSSSHRAIAGKLDNAYCVINKKFRQIPDQSSAESR